MDNLVAVQLAQNKPTPCHSEASLSARNLLAASSEAADSSCDNPALRNDNGFFESHHYEKPATLSFSAERRKTNDPETIKYNYIICNYLRSFLNL
jgi:hypothetical protein